MPRIQQAVYLPDRIQRTALRPISVLFCRQVRLEDRSQDQHCRHHRYAIADRRNAERPELAIRLRDKHPSDRFRFVLLLFEFLRQFPQPPFQPIRLDVFKPFSVHTRRALIGFAAGVGVLQYIGSIQLVVQGVEPKARVFLRFGM